MINEGLLKTAVLAEIDIPATPDVCVAVAKAVQAIMVGSSPQKVPVLLERDQLGRLAGVRPLIINEGDLYQRVKEVVHSSSLIGHDLQHPGLLAMVELTHNNKLLALAGCTFLEEFVV